MGRSFVLFYTLLGRANVKLPDRGLSRNCGAGQRNAGDREAVLVLVFEAAGGTQY
jgi:hypothetical protein